MLRPPSHRFEARFILTEVTLEDGQAPHGQAHPAAWGNYVGHDGKMRRADQDWAYLALDDCMGETMGI